MIVSLVEAVARAERGGLEMRDDLSKLCSEGAVKMSVIAVLVRALTSDFTRVQYQKFPPLNLRSRKAKELQDQTFLLLFFTTSHTT